jgi:hypothetical protein
MLNCFFLLARSSQEKTMEKLQKFCVAVLLTFALALSAFAGDIGAPGDGGPPSKQLICVSGDAGCHDPAPSSGEEPPDTTIFDPVTEAALSLLDSILSLF